MKHPCKTCKYITSEEIGHRIFTGCSDDENKTNGGNNGTGGDPVESEYKVTFSDTSYYSSVATL